MGGVLGMRLDRLAWAAAGLAVVAVVGYVLYAFVGAVVVGIFLYYATRPVERWIDADLGYSRVAAAASLLTVGLPLFLIMAYAFSVGAMELNQLFATYRLEQFRTLLEPYLALPPLTRPETAIDLVRDNADRIVASVGALLLWAGRLFVTVVVAYYLLRDDEKISRWLRRSVGEDHDVVRFLSGVDRDLDTIYTGNLLTIAITAAIAVATFYAFDLLAPGDPTVRFPILLGLLVGVFTIVPTVGMKAIWVPYAGYLFLRSLAWNELPLWVPVAFAVVTLVVVDFLPDVFVRSYVSKGDINMGLMLLSYTLGAIVFGWYGLFLGPLVLVLFLHFAERVFPNVVDRGSVRLVDE